MTPKTCPECQQEFESRKQDVDITDEFGGLSTIRIVMENATLFVCSCGENKTYRAMVGVANAIASALFQRFASENPPELPLHGWRWRWQRDGRVKTLVLSHPDA